MSATHSSDHDHDDAWLDDDHLRWGDHDDFTHFDVDHYPTLDVSDHHYVLVSHHEHPFVIVNHRAPTHDDDPSRRDPDHGAADDPTGPEPRGRASRPAS